MRVGGVDLVVDLVFFLFFRLLPTRLFGKLTCGDGCGVATGREEPLKSGGTGYHNLLITYP